MLCNTKGIVLHNIKYGESSIICKIFTKDYGLLSFIVNGIRSSKSREKVGVFQPMNMLDIVMYLRDNKNLLHIKEFKSAFAYQSLPFQFEKSAFGLFILELLNKTIKTEREPNSEKYEFIEESLLHLDAMGKISPDFHLQFMLKYTQYIGFMPDIQPHHRYFDLETGMSTDEIPTHPHYTDQATLRDFHTLINTSFSGENILQINREIRKGYLKWITYYYTYHVEQFSSMKSPEILAELYL